MDKDPPSYCMLSLVNEKHTIRYSFLYNGERFDITLCQEHLRGPGSLESTFLDFASSLDSLVELFRFEDWVLDAVKEYTSQTGGQTTTLLEDVAGRPTHVLELVNSEGRLHPVEKHAAARKPPRARISTPQQTHGGEKGQGGGSGGVSVPDVPRLLASQLQRIVDDEDLASPPRLVRRLDRPTTTYLFRPAYEDRVDELGRLGVIAGCAHMFVPPFRVSRLAALVVWDDDPETLMGWLVDCVRGETLDAAVLNADADLKMKWISEVEVTLRRLHECGVVWGAVSPRNVVINADGDAVIVGLGPPTTLPYDADNGHMHEQTIREDVLGLERMRAGLGLIDQSLYSATSSR